jgi:hypothetical protein
MHLDIIKVFLSINEYTRDCLKNNIKIYIKIALICFGAVTPSSRSALPVRPYLPKLHFVKTVNYGTSMCD